MNIGNKQLIEIIGVLGVIASLIFVGMQLLFDRRVALGEQYFNRSESYKSDQRIRLESDAYISSQLDSWEAGIRPRFWTDSLEQYISDQKISYKGVISEIILDQIYLMHVDNLYYQYSRGLLEEEFWLGTRASLKENFQRDPIRYAIFQSNPRILQPIMNEIVSELEASK